MKEIQDRLNFAKVHGNNKKLVKKLQAELNETERNVTVRKHAAHGRPFRDNQCCQKF